MPLKSARAHLKEVPRHGPRHLLTVIQTPPGRVLASHECRLRVAVPQLTAQLEAGVIDAAAGTADLIYRAGASGADCWTRNHRGDVRALPMTRWIGGADITTHDRLTDEHVIELCSRGPTLDLGCGPGRFVAALQQRGRAALGIDSSVAAVEMTRRRGGVAIRGDLFGAIPAEGCWAQILLLDGNVGIGGDPVRTLRRSAELLAPDGVVIVEIEKSVAAIREILRWETENHVGPWFPWSRIDSTSLDAVAGAAGLAVREVTEIDDRLIAVLTVAR